MRERAVDAPALTAKFRFFEELLSEHLVQGFDPAIQYAIGGLRATPGMAPFLNTSMAKPCVACF